MFNEKIFWKDGFTDAEAKLDYLGTPIEIVINNDTEFFKYKE